MLSVLHEGPHHPEGVAWDPAGWIVYGSDNGTISRFNPETSEVQNVASWEGFLLGIAVDAAGRIYVCDKDQQMVFRVDPETGQRSPYSKGSSNRKMFFPNYPAFTSDGLLYVSDSGTWGSADGVIFAIHPDGSTFVASTAAAGYTNGLALHPDGTHLYVAESNPPALTRLRLTDDGTLDDYEVVLALPDTVPDGLAFATDGTLLISCFRPDQLLSYREGTLSTLVNDKTGLTLNAPTNVCFFGPNLDRLVTGNLGGWHLTEVETTLVGVPVPRPSIP